MPNSAEDYIAAFRRGEDFRGPAVGVFSGSRPDPRAVHLLGQELGSSTDGAVRENLVLLLADMGLRADPLTAQGAEVLREQDIIRLLATHGLARADLGRDAAIDALRKLVRPTDLAPFEVVIAEAFARAPTTDGFLLVAKAKAASAAATVERLAQTPEWRGEQAVAIARAALGDDSEEARFIAEAAAAEADGDGEALAQALATLGLVGTRTSLVEIARRLRTPLTFEVPGAFEKSVRLSALEALLYNFPDQPVLYPARIIREADYTAAEQFCTRILGVTWTAPPPPFLTYRGFPISR